MKNPTETLPLTIGARDTLTRLLRDTLADGWPHAVVCDGRQTRPLALDERLHLADLLHALDAPPAVRGAR